MRGWGTSNLAISSSLPSSLCRPGLREIFFVLAIARQILSGTVAAATSAISAEQSVKTLPCLPSLPLARGRYRSVTTVAPMFYKGLLYNVHNVLYTCLMRYTHKNQHTSRLPTAHCRRGTTMSSACCSVSSVRSSFYLYDV